MKKKTTLTILIILIVLCIFIGISYAYWLLAYEQMGFNRISTSCLSLSLTNEKNDINLQKAYPISDEEGQTLTPYSFTITNTCDLFASFTINLEILENTTIANKYVKIMLNKEATQNLDTYETTTTTIDSSIDSKVLATGSLGSGDSVDYTLRLWMDGSTPALDETMNKAFYSKIIVQTVASTYSPCEQGYTKLNDAILANEYQTTPDISKQKIANKQAVDFSKTAPMIDWQENHATTTTTFSRNMPHPDLVGNGEDYSKNLTNENILPRVGTSYTFDTTTGNYKIEDLQYLDPSIISDYMSTNYYYCAMGFTLDSEGVINPYQNVKNCSTIYRLTNVTESDSQTTISTGINIKIKVYKFIGYAYSQSELESDKSDKGLYQINDTDGTSYYYRGSVTNNYVKFGDFYWRIIRINGDGSIRLLYAGNKSNATGNNLVTTLTDDTLGFDNKISVKFNSSSANSGYVGYMYGNTLNSSYEKTNANENDSFIKKYLDSWYKQNIENKGLSSYIADAGFCNDRSLASAANYPDNGDGVQSGGKITYYGGYERYYKIKQPTLVCPNESNDLFTTSASAKGNKALTYPIGLTTLDELMLSGMVDGYLNRLNYAYSNSTYWTMTPTYFSTNSVGRVAAYDNAGLLYMSYALDNGFGVRPVINLNSDIEITRGIGTSNDPFVIKTS